MSFDIFRIHLTNEMFLLRMTFRVLVKGCPCYVPEVLVLHQQQSSEEAVSISFYASVNLLFSAINSFDVAFATLNHFSLLQDQMCR